jgi:KaiC/GvpD/RAD55 family RecA-like ATPase
LISGTPGTMKSSVCYSILYNNAKHHGTRSVYMTLEQSKENLLQQMNLMGLSDPVVQEKVYVLDLATIRKNVTEMMSKGSWLQVFKMYAETIKKDQGYDLLVLDSLDVLEMAAQLNNDRRNDLFYLFMWLRNMGITSFLISETSPDQMFNSRFEEGYLADGVIALKLQNIGEADVQRRIRCIKLRSTNHKTGYFSLMFSDGMFRATQVINE